MEKYPSVRIKQKRGEGERIAFHLIKFQFIAQILGGLFQGAPGNKGNKVMPRVPKAEGCSEIKEEEPAQVEPE